MLETKYFYLKGLNFQDLLGPSNHWVLFIGHCVVT